MRINQKISIKDLPKMQKLHNNGKSFREIAEIYNVSKSAVYVLFKKHNARVNKHNNKISKNKDYFKKIDSHTKAYILGFIAADGCLYKNSLTFVIHPKDNEVLELIKKEISPSSKIEYRDVLNKRLGKKVPSSRLRIHSKEIIFDLKKLGLKYRKSSTLNYEDLKIPNEYFNSFLRGYVDGDGHLSSKRKTVSFLGTTDFCLGVSKKLKEFGVKTTVTKPLYNEFTSQVNVSRNSQVSFLKLLDFNKFALTRKKNEALTIVNN